MPPKKQEVQRQPPPKEEFHPLGYEEVITYDPKEAGELQSEANMDNSVQPRVIPKGSRMLKDGREETRFFIRRKPVVIPKAIALFLILSSLFCGNVFAERNDSGLDVTRDFHDRQVDPNTLNEIFARTYHGAEIRRIANVDAVGGALNLVTGDIYAITTDTTITSINIASSWAGRIVHLIRQVGTANSVQITDGSNLNLPGDNNLRLASGDNVTLLCGQGSLWYAIATMDNYAARPYLGNGVQG